MTWPGWISANARLTSGINGSTVAFRLLNARMTTRPSVSDARFCWYGMLRSIVTSASNSDCAAARRAPLLSEPQPRSRTVRTSMASSNSGFRRRSTFSSSSTRMLAHGGVEGKLEECRRLLPADAGKTLEEVFQRVPRGQVLDQALDRDARAGEH